MILLLGSGRSGYPIVDAGMREFWATGWMHNRMRMIAASFLVKDLLLSWQSGEEWFWHTLVDADLANNAASWQWVAGCGADSAPTFASSIPCSRAGGLTPRAPMSAVGSRHLPPCRPSRLLRPLDDALADPLLAASFSNQLSRDG